MMMNSTENLVELVNAIPKVIPERVGVVETLTAAITYSDNDKDAPALYMGSEEALLTAFPHDEIAESITTKPANRVSAVSILASNGIFLALDVDQVSINGGLERFQEALGDEFDEVLLGGYAEDESSRPGIETLCTTGLIREVSKFMRLGTLNQMTMGQTQLAAELSISQLANGLPMSELMCLDFAKSEDI